MKDGYRIIDGHVHSFPSIEIAKKVITAFNKNYDIGFKTLEGTIEELSEILYKSKIDGAVLANFAPTGMLHENNLLNLKLAEEDSRFRALVSFHPDMEGDMERYLEEYIELGAAGLKIHPMAQDFDAADGRLDTIYFKCGENNLPVVFHCGRVSNKKSNDYSDLSNLLPAIEKHFDTNFVLTHMADGNVEDVIWLSENFENVLFDTSIIISGYDSLIANNEPTWKDNAMVCDIINNVGASKVIFGSDYPWGSPAHDLKRVIKLELEEEQLEQILGLNAQKLYGFE